MPSFFGEFDYRPVSKPLGQSHHASIFQEQILVRVFRQCGDNQECVSLSCENPLSVLNRS
ncbi:Uncharacterised protein [Vibrio cholerae]|uniref:Uncharacterized protein n=1 Tax=Vibrio cholerae TaxID=666 RepID=A0A655SED6_VIBCL|nr:Uncharacterised protein [Vibrio cholerae]CSC15911.1 Uncharacterised protein [Vibrio cholerae]CSC57081.1 Uncharacterised protein [Vibrio cholerae]